MAHTTADELRIDSRRSKIAALVLSGVTNQFEIMHRLGMDDIEASQPTISRDLLYIREQWRASAVRDWDEIQGKELARIDLLEKEAWFAWERSKTQRSRTRKRVRILPDGKPGDTDSEDTTEQRDGDPRFLTAIMDCIKRRCDLLGLDAVSPRQRNEEPSVDLNDPEQRQRATDSVVALLAALREDPAAQPVVTATDQPSQ